MSAVVDTDAVFGRMVDELSRRGFLGGALGAVALGLAACSSDSQPDHGSSASAAGPWTWTDDRGKRLDLPSRPKRVAFLTDTVGAALWSAGLHPIAATDSRQGIVSAVGMPHAGIAQVYSADDGVNVETLAAARPDLLVDAVQADGTLQVASTLPAVAKLAPVIGLSTYNPVERIATTADQLTASLGRTVTDTGAKARYEGASTALHAAVEANATLRVGFVFQIDDNTLGVMNPRTWAVLKTVHALGMSLVPVPGGADDTYSHAVSWENAPSIPADLLVWAVADPLPDNKLWHAIPAVRAGQVWQPDIASWYAYSWANFASLLDGLATHVHAARAGVGPRSGS